MKPTNLLFYAAAVAACANVATPSTHDAARLAEARALLADEPSRALDVAESLLAVDPDWRDARLVLAEGSWRLARSGQGQANLHLIDAATNFDRALAGVDDADAPRPLQMLAECRYELGEFEAAREVALRAGRGFAATDVPENRRAAAEMMLLAGRCDLQRLVAARQMETEGGKTDSHGVVPVGKEVQRLAASAAQCFEAARLQLPGPATMQMKLLHEWLGQPSEALRELERGLRAAPGATEIHDAYIAQMRDAGQFAALLGGYARLVRENPSTPILRWHQGRAVYEHAVQLRSEGNFQGALEAYGKCDAIFAEYVAMVPEHRDSANQWRALCSLAMARAACDLGDLTGAERHLLAAAEVSPLTTRYENGAPLVYDGFGNHFTAAAFAIHRALTEVSDDALARTLGFNERLLQRVPDQWGFLYNNAALAARDLGVQRAKANDAAAAQELWERSFRYYEKAVELSPDDARIVNDCGLMLVYHLDRELPRARGLFERAIALGQAQLAALPADSEPRERERLEEAVGDAWQNIAVLLRNHEHRPFGDYREYCEQAVKYYPFQRREAAMWLRTEGRDDAASTSRSLPGALASDPQGGAAEAMQKQAAAVKAKVAAEDFDGALTLLDSISKECKDHAPFHALRGELNLKLAAQGRASGRKGVDLLFQDAVAALKRAVELDAEPVAPRRMLAEAQYESGDTDAAARTLSGLLLHMQSQGGGQPDDLLALHTLRAKAAARAYAEKKQNNQDDQELLAATRASCRFLDEKGNLDATLRQTWSTTEQWAGAGAEAVNIWVRALRRTPDDGTLFDPLLNTAAQTGQLPLAIEALGQRDDATTLWYLGKARFWFADVERQAKRFADGQKQLDQAKAHFAASMAKNPQFRDSCEQWLAMVLGKKGNLAFWADDLANAETWLLEAAKSRPDQIATDLGLTDTTKMGLMRVADKHFRKNDLGRVEAIYRAASDAANSDLDLLNNSGLFARDYGNALERDGKMKEAMAMYEQSYKAYRRAQQLDPQNVRLRNDCALIAIWHLERDWDLSKQLLDSAIADGEKTLAENPPSDANDKQMLDEAVGDCYENLALWQLKHGKDGKAAKAAAEQSQKHFPGERRPGARRHLQAAERLLQGK